MDDGCFYAHFISEFFPRRMSSEESAYTTDETSDEEEKRPSTPPRKTCKAPRRWQPSEDRRLAESVKQHGEANWKAIAARVGSRNHVQCLQRWKKVRHVTVFSGHALVHENLHGHSVPVDGCELLNAWVGLRTS